MLWSLNCIFVWAAVLTQEFSSYLYSCTRRRSIVNTYSISLLESPQAKPSRWHMQWTLISRGLSTFGHFFFNGPSDSLGIWWYSISLHEIIDGQESDLNLCILNILDENNVLFFHLDASHIVYHEAVTSCFTSGFGDFPFYHSTHSCEDSSDRPKRLVPEML